jgi:hypothetical protein
MLTKQILFIASLLFQGLQQLVSLILKDVNGLLILFGLSECLSQPLLFGFERRFVMGKFLGQAYVFLSGACDQVSELALFKAEALVLLGQVNEVLTVALEATFQVLVLSCLIPGLLLVVSSEI